jgi:thiosulfate/3-mercaptopyruvate sulfurtransferase
MLLALAAVPAARAAPVTVDGAWLEARLGDPQVVIVDMTGDDLQFRRYHIPGAVRLAYEELLKPRPGKPAVRLGEAEFAALLGQRGIARDRHVVIYDDLGGLNAGRLFLELERVAHPRVSVLDGGLVRWVLDGRPLANDAPPPKPVRYVAGDERRENLAAIETVRRASGEAGGPVLLDVRSREEYAGEEREARSGHVPRARWWPWEQAIGIERGFTFREPAELLASLGRAGVPDRQTPVIIYCRTGHRASQTYLTLRRLGFADVRVHAGSMVEYLLDRAAPLARGLAP